MAETNAGLVDQIEGYFKHHENDLSLKGIHILPGGELIKNDDEVVDRIYRDIERERICRHSYVGAIGGGAILDTVGYAAATAHRGIRHFSVPNHNPRTGRRGCRREKRGEF